MIQVRLYFLTDHLMFPWGLSVDLKNKICIEIGES